MERTLLKVFIQELGFSDPDKILAIPGAEHFFSDLPQICLILSELKIGETISEDQKIELLKNHLYPSTVHFVVAYIAMLHKQYQ